MPTAFLDTLVQADHLPAEHRFLWRQARRLTRSDQDADDLAQEVWLEALQRPPEVVHRLRGWLGVVTSRTASRLRRRDRNRRLRELRVARPEGVGSRGSDALGGPGDDVRLERLGALVGELKPPYREVVTLRYVHDLSIAEICARLERPPGTVRCQLKRGLDQVRLRAHESCDKV